MRFTAFGPIAVAVIALLGASSCTGDAPSAPITSAPAKSQTLVRYADVLSAPISVPALQRTSPLATSEQASATIGLLGGRLSLPGAGLTVVVPPLAVVSPVHITVTALAGSNVAYEFSPHGTRFLAPLLAIQDLRNTDAASGGIVDPLSLAVGYFADSSQVTTVTELLGDRVDLLAQLSTVALWHFSGYMWSSGQESNPSDTTGALSTQRWRERRLRMSSRVPNAVR